MSRGEPVRRKCRAALPDTSCNPGIGSDGKSDSVPLTVWLLIVAAFVGSLVFSVALNPHSPDLLASDSAEYNSHGVSILRNQSYGGTYRAPGYPILLAAIYSVAGSDSLVPVYVVQSLLLALTLLLTYRIALRITQDAKLSLIAIALCAVWPPIVSSAGDVMTETFSGFLMAASLLLLMRTTEKPQVLGCFSLGILLGFASLTKGALLLFALAGPVFVVLAGKARLRNTALSALVLAGVVVVVAPWTYRNYRVTGAFVPVQTGAGMNFFLGNWPGYWTQRYEFGTYPQEVERAIEGKSEIERERVFQQWGVRYILEDPVRASGIFLRKFSFLWMGALGTDPRAAENPILHIGDFGITKRSVLYVPLFLAAVFGWFALSREARRRARPMMWLLLLSSLPYIVAVAVARYAVPMVYYEMILVAATMRQIGVKDK